MARYSTESLDWLDQLAAVGQMRKEDPHRTGASMAAQLKMSPAHASYLTSLNDCLDQAAIDKIRQAASPQSGSPFLLSLKGARILPKLKGKVSDLPGAIHAALDVILASRLTTGQIKALVAWVISGKPASEFDPKAKPVSIKAPPSANKALGQPGHVAQADSSPESAQYNHGPKKVSSAKDHAQEVNASPTDLDLKKIRQSLEKAEAERIAGKETKEQEKLLALIRKIAGSSPSQAGDKASSTGDDLFETVFQDWLADIPVIAQIKAKVKKKKTLTRGEKTLLWLHKGGELMGRGLKRFFKLFKPLFKLVHVMGKLVVEALKDLGLYKYAKAIFTLVMVVVALWFAWEAWRYGVMRPVEMIWSRIPWGQLSHREPVTSASDVPPPGITLPAASPIVRSAELGSSKLRTSNSSLRTTNSTAVTYAPAAPWMPAVEDPKVLDTEIASVPANSGVKDHAVTLDEGMPGDLAVSRLQDLTDANKYTMKIGSGIQNISSVNATATNLIVNYKSTDPLALGGSGPINIFWEDVKVIHVNEIDHFSKAGVQTDSAYQFGLVASGAKIPFTIQCASPDDLQHLVSTIEYFIRNSRLGHDTALGGMPYPSQGVILTNDNVVDKLWTDSPMDKAGIQLGDHLWSVGVITPKPQSRNELEAGLASLPVTLFAASSSVWDKALIAFHAPGQGNPFKPKLRKMVLAAP
jgi:hypothetical protein